MIEYKIKFSEKLDSPYVRRRNLSNSTIYVMERAVDLKLADKPWEHIQAYSDALGIPYHRVMYAAHRLQVLGIVKLHKIGCMVFIEYIKPVGEE